MAEKRINGSVIPYSESGDRAQDEVGDFLRKLIITFNFND